MLTSAFRAGSRLVVVLSCVNAGILLLDGLVHSERLSTRYLTVTVASALMFGAIGAATFGLHLSLDKIRGHSIGGNRNVVAELALPWKVVQRVLALMLAFAIVLMASASIAMIGRLRQGFTIFG